MTNGGRQHALGNSLRALVKYLDGLAAEDVVGFNIPTGKPLFYESDESFKPLTADGTYLDPDAGFPS